MLNRDELILSCQNCVKNLVKKYNNHHEDEDLQSVGMIAVVECVDRCLNENMTDEKQIQARCNTWAKNRILNEVYQEKLKFVDEDFILETVEAPEDIKYLILSVASELTPRQLDVFNLLLDGKSNEEIADELHITAPTLYEHIRNIKKIIKLKP